MKKRAGSNEKRIYWAGYDAGLAGLPKEFPFLRVAGEFGNIVEREWLTGYDHGAAMRPKAKAAK